MKLLYLTHRIPYPPNKGDKISSFNIMKHLSRNNEIYLGTFIDDKKDIQYVDKLFEYCTDICARRLFPKAARLRSLSGLLTNAPLSVRYYRDARLQAWVDHILGEVRPQAVLMYSGAMGQFVRGRTGPGVRTVFNAEDVDSAKWAHYAQGERGPMRLLYAREGRRLLEYEREMARTFDLSVFISEAEASLFRSLCPEAAEKIVARTQGVDTAYFDPDRDYANPYAPSEDPLIFVGAMDYRPNVQAANWFARSIFPKIRDARPDARFYIVGMSPADAVRRLADQPGIVVTGGVPDVRPYVKHARAAVLPLTIARGIQNKAIEAMAMAKPIVATPEAMAGILTCPGQTLRLASSAEAFIEAVLDQLSQGPCEDRVAREFVEAHYGWEASMRRYEELVFQSGAS